MFTFTSSVSTPVVVNASMVPFYIYYTPPPVTPTSHTEDDGQEEEAYSDLDAETIQALQLFAAHDPSRRQRSQSEAVRRARHREIQRRFMQRKTAAFKARKSEAAKLEILLLTLQLETERKALEQEQTVLREKMRACDIQVLPVDETIDGQRCDDEHRWSCTEEEVTV